MQSGILARVGNFGDVGFFVILYSKYVIDLHSGSNVGLLSA
jgi:hypothetical protein